MKNSLTIQKSLSSNALKYIAIIAMTIDHLGWAFVPLDTALGQAMHFIGRFTAPIMCYFIAEGFHYTHDVNKYLKRLGIFAIICYPIFVLKAYIAKYGVENFVFDPTVLFCQSSVFVTLFLGLLALKTWNSKLDIKAKVALIILFCLLSYFGDWMCLGVLWVLFFGIFRGDFKKQVIAYYALALVSITYVAVPSLIYGQPLTSLIWQLGQLVPPLILLLYNGKKGSSHPFNKWFFYIFYPLHLIIIELLKLYIC